MVGSLADSMLEAVQGAVPELVNNVTTWDAMPVFDFWIQ